VERAAGQARRIGVLTTGRQDWGILRSTATFLRDAPDFELVLLAGGMACSVEHGRIVDTLRADGFVVAAEMPWSSPDKTAADEAAAATAQVAAALALHPSLECLLLVGDRYETLAAGLAATIAKVPIVHLHGGEETEGALDNSFRHALTKLAHLHFVSHPDYRRRVLALGEDPAAVHVVGAPGLDNLHRADLASSDELSQHLGVALDARTKPLVVVTLQPTTLAKADEEGAELTAMLAAMDAVDALYVVTLPNNDPGGAALRQRLVDACQVPGRMAVSALGERRYWGLLAIADAVLGNSSSALIEAPALLLPAVDIGDRQRGRLCGRTVLHAAPEAAAVARALRQALDPAFRATLTPADALFGDGHSATRIAQVLRQTTFPRPPIKKGIALPPLELPRS
jgi:UDP-hydrolysing UDP-N-acetyl-D-glucosamine 2-epimerase